MELLTYNLNVTEGGYYVCSPAWNSKGWESIDRHRFYFTLHGRASVKIGVQTVNLEGGRVYFLPGHHPHVRICDDKLTLYWMHFQPLSPWLDARLAHAAPRAWPIRRWKAWAPVYRRLPEFLDERNAVLGFRVRALAFELLAALLDEDRAGAPFDAAAFHALEALRPALAFMDRHFCEHPTLPEVAAAVHLSPVHFHRLFKSALGLTPHAYLERKRMQRAQGLLSKSTRTVAEVAENCGYGNAFYFSRAFKKVVGESPMKWRKRARQPMP